MLDSLFLGVKEFLTQHHSAMHTQLSPRGEHWPTPPRRGGQLRIQWHGAVGAGCQSSTKVYTPAVPWQSDAVANCPQVDISARWVSS